MKEILDQVRDNLDEIFGKYDEASRELLRIARLDGHFADWDPSEVAWPEHPADVTGLEKRDRLITTIYEGIPSRRDSRLAEAYDGYRHAMGPYLGANCIFLDVQRQFLSRGAGDESEFLQLYQTVYLEALGRDDQISLDAGEAALVEFRVARAPLSHAQSVAEKIQTQAAADDPRWNDLYSYSVDGDGETKTAGAEQATLREALTLVAESVVDALAKGEHLAIRYNTFSNFIWFGISVWKVVSDVDLLVTRLRGSVRGRWLDKLEIHVRLAQALLLKFLEAHLEDPAQIRPKDYWFGQQYSYLTRDMIDLVRELAAGATKLSRRARGNGQELPVIEIPPLLCGQAVGRFVEYPSPVGASGLPPTPWQQRARALGWVRIFRQRAQRTRRLRDAGLEEAERLAAAWRNADDWGRRTLDLFGIQLEVRIDPQFECLASRLDLSGSGRKIVFFPTHQSLLDHPVMYRVLHSPELMRAMGWENPVPCVLLSRVGLTTPTEIKVGGFPSSASTRLPPTALWRRSTATSCSSTRPTPAAPRTGSPSCWRSDPASSTAPEPPLPSTSRFCPCSMLSSPTCPRTSSSYPSPSAVSTPCGPSLRKATFASARAGWRSSCRHRCWERPPCCRGSAPCAPSWNRPPSSRRSTSPRCSTPSRRIPAEQTVACPV